MEFIFRYLKFTAAAANLREAAAFNFYLIRAVRAPRFDMLCNEIVCILRHVEKMPEEPTSRGNIFPRESKGANLFSLVNCAVSALHRRLWCSFEDHFVKSDGCREMSEATATFAQRLYRLSLFRGKCHGVTYHIIATLQLCTHYAYICMYAIEQTDRIINVNYRVSWQFIEFSSFSLPLSPPLSVFVFRSQLRASFSSPPWSIYLKIQWTFHRY